LEWELSAHIRIEVSSGVVVEEPGARGPASATDSGPGRDVRESPVAVVAVENVGSEAGHVEVEVPIVVVIAHGHACPEPAIARDASLAGDINESAFARVA